MAKTMEEVQEGIEFLYGSEFVKFKEIEEVCETVCRIISKSNCYNHLNLYDEKINCETFFEREGDLIIKHFYVKDYLIAEIVFLIKDPNVDAEYGEYEFIKFKLFQTEG